MTVVTCTQSPTLVHFVLLQAGSFIWNFLLFFMNLFQLFTMLLNIFQQVRNKISILRFGNCIFAHQLLEVTFHIDGMIIGRVLISTTLFYFLRLIANFTYFVLTIVFRCFGMVVGKIIIMRLNFAVSDYSVMGFVLINLSLSFWFFLWDGF